ncbi:membrane fusion protein (multidrug efflux system) [Sphingomonas kyeonggiensis]|uniref:HlyD family secretion protein n=1 Tax=Sphingomonas kyeonggiensis TaxID=1268553 RepID=UPI00278AE88E|nr:HlyD family secretion protein [Sphingomonas kyeonggiensis]MDQ0249404.1 membrane fusion protein (multidrug efflux system) [Sphingomonas kyeonggiensis]
MSEQAETGKRRKLPKAALAGGVAVLLAASGALWITSPASSETTDNAYLRADSTIVSARIGGQIAELLVRDNQEVKAGDPLVRIEDREFAARLDAARAAVRDADAAVAAALAAIKSHGAETRLASADVAVVRTAIASTSAELQRAEADDARYQALLAQGFATRRDAERIHAALLDARAKARQSGASLAASQDKAGVTIAQKDSLLAALESARAGAERARAALRLAEQDESYTLVRAPVGGVVGNRRAQPGDFVQPGTRLLTLVPSRQLYVVANFKETQTARMLAGQPARVHVDALGDAVLTGHVESFAPGSGSEFTLLPFEPGSGNFTKIVQRVPVRIALDANQPALSRLRPGLSTTVTVRLAR